MLVVSLSSGGVWWPDGGAGSHGRVRSVIFWNAGATQEEVVGGEKASWERGNGGPGGDRRLT